MKKLLVVMATLMVAFGAQARWWAGGGIGFGFNSVVDGNTTVNFFLAPEVGYQLNDRWDVAFELGYDMAHTDGATLHVFDMGPYARYNIADFGRFSFFTEGALHYVHSHLSPFDNDGFNIQIRPGLAFNMNERWSLVGKINLLQYQYLGGSSIGFEVSTGLSVGFIYKFN